MIHAANVAEGGSSHHNWIAGIAGLRGSDADQLRTLARSRGCTGYALHPATFRLVCAASRSSPILMMQAPENRKGDDFRGVAAYEPEALRWLGNLLVDALVRP